MVTHCCGHSSGKKNRLLCACAYLSNPMLYEFIKLFLSPTIRHHSIKLNLNLLGQFDNLDCQPEQVSIAFCQINYAVLNYEQKCQANCEQSLCQYFESVEIQ